MPDSYRLKPHGVPTSGVVGGRWDLVTNSTQRPPTPAAKKAAHLGGPMLLAPNYAGRQVRNTFTSRPISGVH